MIFAFFPVKWTACGRGTFAAIFSAATVIKITAFITHVGTTQATTMVKITTIANRATATIINSAVAICPRSALPDGILAKIAAGIRFASPLFISSSASGIRDASAFRVATGRIAGSSLPALVTGAGAGVAGAGHPTAAGTSRRRLRQGRWHGETFLPRCAAFSVQTKAAGRKIPGNVQFAAQIQIAGPGLRRA